MDTGRRQKASFFILLAMYALTIPAFAQTALPMTDPTVLAKLAGNKTEIERCILLATPDSLAKAKDGITQSKLISENDRTALLEIVRGISWILYPSHKPSTDKNATNKTGFYVEGNIQNANPVYSLALTQLVEASQGRVFVPPKTSETSYVTEILPSLAIFKSSDPDIARTALAYADRYGSTEAPPSVMAGFVRARYAMLQKDWLAAYSAYRPIYDAYPDAWPARLGLGIVSLQIQQPVNALNYLAPLAETRPADNNLAAPLATALYRNGRFAEAEPWALKAVGLQPDSGELSMIVAHILIDKRDFAGASRYLDAFGRASPASPMYFRLRAAYARGLNRPDEAIKWARRALQADPADPDAMVLLAGLLYAGPAEGHAEASSLCREAQKIMAAGIPTTLSPLAKATRQESSGEAERLLLLDAYNNQQWSEAASLLDETSTLTLDKKVVATILRKSGDTKDAIAFTSDWYKNSPNSEDAAEAYLRSLSAASVASAQTGSDVPTGLSGVLAGLASSGSSPGSPQIIGLVLQLLSGSYSPSMRSYLQYLRGTLQSNPDAAIEAYRAALLERADNVEALIGLANAYYAKNDPQKAMFYVKQAKLIGVQDADLAKELSYLETKLTASL